MDELIRHLEQLPKNETTCQGGVIAWPQSLRADDGSEFRPHFPLWADADSGAVHSDTLLEPEDDFRQAALETLGGFVEKFLRNRACPRRLQVSDPELADYLRAKLARTGIEVELMAELPVLDQAISAMSAFVEAVTEGPAGLLDSRGVTIERVRAFAEAAADFYRAAPWRHLSDSDLIHVESPKPPKGMQCFVVLGVARSTYGLGIYPSQAAYERFLRAGESGEYDIAISAGLTQVIFEPIEEFPSVDGTLWTEHQLPVAGDKAYPTVVKHLGNGEVKRPTKKELTYLEGLARALAATRETDIDSGRWCKQVTTFDGPVEITLAIPDLLQPLRPTDYLKRGFPADPRAHERMLADLERVLQEHPPESEEDLQRIGAKFAGRSLDNPLTKSSTPAEHAQDLCYQAYDAHGRRRVQLARQALELDRDCADAHVILAEHVGTLEESLEHLRRGMEAAERTLGAEYFAENVGRFWGLFPTRPYMRARFGLADTLAEAGRLDEAIGHYQELLRLNPHDNQGARYVLLPKLLATGREAEAARLLKQYDETSAVWAYARALLAFCLSGRSAAADRELREALRINPHVPELLDSELPIPQSPLYSPGSFEEACFAAEELKPAFDAIAGATEWIREFQIERATELDKLRRERRRKERAKRKKRKGR